jgi:hypothetical protein
VLLDIRGKKKEEKKKDKRPKAGAAELSPLGLVKY